MSYWVFVTCLLFATGALLAPAAGATQVAEANQKDDGDGKKSSEVAPIEQAKRQFDAVRGLKQSQSLGSGQQGLRFEVGIPALEQNPATPVITRPSAVPSRPGTQSAGGLEMLDVRRGQNWLVESMRSSSKVGGAVAADSIARDAEPRGMKAAGYGESVRNNNVSASSRGQSSESGNSSNFGGVEAINPFTPYLSSWMTAKDYALLVDNGMRSERSKSTAGESLVSGSSTLRNSDAEGKRLAEAGFGGKYLNRPVRSAGAIGNNAVVNPYLKQFETVPALEKPAVSQIAKPSSDGIVKTYDIRGYSIQSPTATSINDAATRAADIPESLKQQSDKKYFRQLKRF